ncbi:MAG: HD domain-containing protein [Burkholderiaceae bacterium]|nr:HD domain-containing protein [Burkholderiaceae bacterium]
MPDSIPFNTQHITRAVTDFGESRTLTLTQALYTSQGVKLLDAGAPINRSVYDRLMQYPLSAPIEDLLSGADPATGKSMRRLATQLLDHVPFLGRMAPDMPARNTLLDAVEHLPLPAPLAFLLTLAQETRPGLYRHAVITALVAAWLVQGPGVTRYDIGLAAAGGLFHDMGMLYLAPELHDDAMDFSAEQRRQLYAHPLISKLLLERQHPFPPQLAQAVAEHHEYLDGSGYPGHLPAGHISPLGQTLAIAEVVSSVLKEGLPHDELHLSVLLRMNQHRFHLPQVQKVMQLLRPGIAPHLTQVAVLKDPCARLLELNGLLGRWPGIERVGDGMDRQRPVEWAPLASQVERLRRTFPQVGIAPDQLTLLSTEPLDSFLIAELSLVARDAAWQLRSLARQSQRRWRHQAPSTVPPALQQWLDEVDQVIRHDSIDPPSSSQPAC